MSQKTATSPARMSTHVMVPLPPDIRSRVEALAATEDRSMAAICRRFIAEGVSRVDTPLTNAPATALRG